MQAFEFKHGDPHEDLARLSRYLDSLGTEFDQGIVIAVHHTSTAEDLKQLRDRTTLNQQALEDTLLVISNRLRFVIKNTDVILLKDTRERLKQIITLTNLFEDLQNYIENGLEQLALSDQQRAAAEPYTLVEIEPQHWAGRLWDHLKKWVS